jgi:hypothetical protein
MEARFSNSEFVRPWLSQFNVAYQPRAVELLDSIVRVSADDFRNRLSILITTYILGIDGHVGLYVERELPTDKKSRAPLPLFAQPEYAPRRARGHGPTPFVPESADVGSEGIIAQLVSELCRPRNSRFLNHSGPDTIREKRVRHLLVVTDFIGSGKRAISYLEALWKVHSVRSWWSLNYVTLGVLAYSGTNPV